ncbi:maleylpyruvate isomerase N-terminal domain-containing protein [Cellulomonas sp. S1-8]|uniref:maleylpyruvate isomerase N-terminal domain-containing protein n=1 Tax=Cellulomonas sp. S1-8 TaxID=2904790 RepID=UPI0022442FD4|nr:maleylpyruvate isomerase N-terminal domain-containing protein [Cellulomonas sp. S1-8]UZN04003.1 maleylpyruvate isomerase N-terminal domain-containing protein [Cellulomonas sp. S1-8]
MPVDVTTAAAALRTQWDRLHGWAEQVADPRLGREASVLDGWTVVELWAHLGRAMDALAACTPLPDDTIPLSLGEYVGTYAGRAQDIADTTRHLAAEHAHDPVGYVRTSAAAAFRTLDALAPGDPVVQARRGPVRLSTMTVSRVLELVVHGDDLYRSVRRVRGADAGPDPVDRDALALVADELLVIVRARGGWDLEVVDPRRWMRLATGRSPYDVDELALALQARYTSDAVPDLGRMLPLL